MRQILQSLNSGATVIADVPIPATQENKVLVKTSKTLISTGTERTLVNFGKSNVISKAKDNPDKVRDVISKIKTDGLHTTYAAVNAKLNEPIALGYCNVGKVIETTIPELPVGSRVVSNGPHAEFVVVPKNLTALIPENVTDDTAAFTVLGAIALQGIRLASLGIGEKVCVIGAGVIGLLAVQILRAHGCNVFVIDVDDTRLELAQKFGAEVLNSAKQESLVDRSNEFTKNVGFDAVLITAATKSNSIVSDAATISRKRGKIILTGVVGLNLDRADFYEKELTFQVSCSYGPGRYDTEYEEQGKDYPIAFVRWTEQRNFETILELMSQQKITVEDLISHQYEFSDAIQAYDLLTSKEKTLGIILNFPIDEPDNGATALQRTINLNSNAITCSVDGCTVNFIGTGNYARRVLIPSFEKAGAELNVCVSSGGISAWRSGRRHGFKKISTDTDYALSEPSSNAVVIATRHDKHTGQIIKALEAGKHVFCEKPLCLKYQELESIRETLNCHNEQILMLGFNRRYSPLSIKAKSLLNEDNYPKSIIITVNAGALPKDHWVNDSYAGGGRIIGEACHFIDFARFLVDAPIEFSNITYAGGNAETDLIKDQASIVLKFSDGSVATINYLANGHNSYPKEVIEIFSSGKILRLDNFRKLVGYGFKNFSQMKLWRQDKGQRDCVKQFVRAISKSGVAPIPVEEIFEISEISIKLSECIND